MAAAKKKKSKKSKDHKEVIALKLIVVFVILLVPLVAIILSMNKQSLILKYKDLKNSNVSVKTNLNQEPKEDFHFDAPIPNERVGSIANVSQDKIDTLFDNLKK